MVSNPIDPNRVYLTGEIPLSGSPRNQVAPRQPVSAIGGFFYRPRDRATSLH